LSVYQRKQIKFTVMKRRSCKLRQLGSDGNEVEMGYGNFYDSVNENNRYFLGYLTTPLYKIIYKNK